MDPAGGLLLDFTGDGKGKTSAALGVVLRAIGHGWRPAVIQFIKDDRPTGELAYFRKYHPDLIFECHGRGFTNRPGEHAAAAREGWKRACELLKDPPGELLVLDELNGALAAKLLELNEVLDALKNRHPGLHVILTGRGTPPELAAVCDLVSEMKEVKHPFRQDIPAQKGLDF